MNLLCRACGKGDLFEMINFGELPVAHRLLSTANEPEKLYPFVVYFCRNCGLIQIVNPIDPQELYLNYNYCFSSWKEEPHAYDEIETILSNTNAKSVFEIGCNDGKFLNLLKQKNIPLLAGLEPNPYASEIARSKGFKVYSQMVNETLCREIVSQFGKFEVVVVREVIEHLTDLQSFFKAINILLNDDGCLFIDTPDIEAALTMGDCSLVWEEHPSCFTERVVCNILRRYGFQPLSVRKYNFSGGVMGIISKRSKISVTVEVLGVELENKARAFKQKVDNYGQALKNLSNRYRQHKYQIVLYGVGCRACTLVNGLKLKPFIDFAVDDQTERQKKYMPGSRLAINSPRVIADSNSSVLCLLAVNQENEKIVQERFRQFGNKQIRFISLFSPNDIWLELRQGEEFLNNERSQY